MTSRQQSVPLKERNDGASKDGIPLTGTCSAHSRAAICTATTRAYVCDFFFLRVDEVADLSHLPLPQPFLFLKVSCLSVFLLSSLLLRSSQPQGWLGPLFVG